MLHFLVVTVCLCVVPIQGVSVGAEVPGVKESHNVDPSSDVYNNNSLHHRRIIGKPPSQTSVAFSASLRQSQFYSKASAVQFDDITTNNGGAYDYKTGVLTAPVSGIYLISYHVMNSPFSTKPAIFDLVRNSQVVNSACGRGLSEAGSNTAVLFLNRYDRLAIRARPWTVIYCQADLPFCSFSVVLIRAGIFNYYNYPSDGLEKTGMVQTSQYG